MAKKKKREEWNEIEKNEIFHTLFFAFFVFDFQNKKKLDAFYCSMTSLPKILAEAARPVLSEAGIWRKPALSARGAAAWKKRLG